LGFAPPFPFTWALSKAAGTGWTGSTIKFVPKATSVKPGTSSSATRKASSTGRNADKVVESARAEADRVRARANADAARIHEQAEEHARRLVLDARATAEGVRAEGMEVVSTLRQISDTLREMSERVREDVETIHTRMLGELPGAVAPESGSAEVPAEPTSDELDVPDFLSHG
jgi:cell division septum initiation protein DivIVA